MWTYRWCVLEWLNRKHDAEQWFTAMKCFSNDKTGVIMSTCYCQRFMQFQLLGVQTLSKLFLHKNAKCKWQQGAKKYHQGQINKQINYAITYYLSTHFHSHLTHPVFVVYNIRQHVIHIQNATISMFQPVDLDPVAGVLGEKKRGGISSVMRSALFPPYRLGDLKLYMSKAIQHTV